MTRFITMNKAQAAAIRGKTSDTTGLDPIPLDDGETYILPIRVLADNKHLIKRSLLERHSVRQVAKREFRKSEIEREIEREEIKSKPHKGE